MNEPSRHVETPLSRPATINNLTDEQPGAGILESGTSAAAMESSDTFSPLNDSFKDVNVGIFVPKSIPRKRRKSRFKSTRVDPRELEPPRKRRRFDRNAKGKEPNLKSISQQQAFRATNKEISSNAEVRKVSSATAQQS